MEETSDKTLHQSSAQKEHSKTSGKRSSYADLGLIIAIGVFICLLIKSLLFGFTWGCIAGIAIAAVYFIVSMIWNSHSPIVRHATTAFLLISVLVASAAMMFDRNARPKMHAFEGTGDTIQDAQVRDDYLKVTMYDTIEEDEYEADSTDIETDSLDDELGIDGDALLYDDADTTLID